MKQTTIISDGKEIHIWESSSNKSFRLVHNDGQCIALFESEGVTSTRYSLFEGTQSECLAEAARLNLSKIPSIVEPGIVDQLNMAYHVSKPKMSRVEYAVKVLMQITGESITKEDIALAIQAANTKLTDDGTIKPVVPVTP